MTLLLGSSSALVRIDRLIMRDARADIIVVVYPLAIGTNYSALNIRISQGVGIKVLAELE
jgi:acetylglutamate kinase